MSSRDNYSKIFRSSLNLDENKFSEEIQYNEVDEWDSIGHMTLISALEEEYKITFETDDIIDFSSFKKGIEILKKYKIDIK
jgi:acyl carrier protein